MSVWPPMNGGLLTTALKPPSSMTSGNSRGQWKGRIGSARGPFSQASSCCAEGLVPAGTRRSLVQEALHVFDQRGEAVVEGFLCLARGGQGGGGHGVGGVAESLGELVGLGGASRQRGALTGSRTGSASISRGVRLTRAMIGSAISSMAPVQAGVDAVARSRGRGGRR